MFSFLKKQARRESFLSCSELLTDNQKREDSKRKLTIYYSELSFTNVSKRDVVFDNFSFMESPTSTQGCPIDVVYSEIKR